MKKIFPVLTLCFLLSLPVFTQVVFEKTYGLSSQEQLIESIALHGEDIILAGYTAVNTNGGDDVLLIKMDDAGNVIWKKNIGGAQNDAAHQVIVVSDGYVLGGETQSMGNGTKDFYLLKTDFDGNVLWERTYGTSNFEICRSLTATDDGGFLLVGDAIVDEVQGQDWWIMKTDAAGNEEWSVFYGDTSLDVVKFVNQLSDGNYLIGGGVGEGVFDGNRSVINLDAAGNINWQIQILSNVRNSSFNSVIEVADGDLLLSGTDGHATVTRVDQSGALVWDYSTFPQGGTFGNDAMKILLLSPDTLLLARDFGWTTSVPFFKLDPEDGSVITEGEFSFDGVKTRVWDIVLTENGYVMAGNDAEIYYPQEPGGYVVHGFDQNQIKQWTVEETVEYPYHKEFGSRVVEASTGNYVFSGTRSNYDTYYNNGKQEILLTSTTPEGELIWEEVISSASQNIDLIVTTDNNLLMANLSADTLELIKLDNDGNILWQQFLELEDGYHFYFGQKSLIKNLPGGGFIIAANVAGFGGFTQRYIQFIRLDTNGTVLFSDFVDAQSTFWDFEITGAGSYEVLVGKSILLYDTDLSLLANRTYDYSLPTEFIEFYSMTPAPNGEYWLSGVVRVSFDDPIQNILLKIDEEGDKIFEAVLGSHADYFVNMKVAVQDDESVLLFGSEAIRVDYVDSFDINNIPPSYSFYNPLRSAFIEKRGADGSYRGRETFGTGVGASFYDGILTSDGMALGFGWYYNLNSDDQYLVKLNPSGIVAVEDTEFDLKDQVIIYPNPGDDFFNYHLNSTAKGKLEIRVFNSVGQQVKYSKFEKVQQQITVPIYTAQLATGIYYIQFLLDGELLKTDRWVKGGG